MAGGGLHLLINHHQAIARHPGRERVELLAFKGVGDKYTATDWQHASKVVGRGKGYVSLERVIRYSARE